MTIDIRHVRPEDAEAVHEIFLNARTIAGTMRLPYQALDYTRDRLQPTDGVIKLVALANPKSPVFANSSPLLMCRVTATQARST